MIEGIYNNARFMHAATSLVGCIVQVLTSNGTIYEGIFRTFSHQFDVVLELAHKLDKGHQKLPSKENIIEKLIIKTPDVVHLTAANADVEYATKENFATDSAISKYNGQMTSERELEPWEGASAEGEELPALDTESANGWDVNDMFKTNEQQYGVQSTYEPTLAGYTIPLEKKNTDEFKKQEAKATKIASEIESSPAYRARIAMENGDEEERFSAVMRPDNAGGASKPFSSRYVPPPKRKNLPAGKLSRTTSSPQQNSHNNISTTKSHPSPGHAPPHTTHSTQGHPVLAPSASATAHSVHTPAHGPPAPPLVQHSQPNLPHAPTHYGPPQQPSPMGNMNVAPHQQQPPPPSHHPPPPQGGKLVAGGDAPSKMEEAKVNGEKLDKDEKKLGSPIDSQIIESREADGQVAPSEASSAHISSKLDRKNLNIKPREEQIAELKKFSSDFQLSADGNEENVKPEQVDSKEKGDSEMEKVSNTLKKSTLNPNAKEFIFNPQAKPYTQRSPSTQTPTPPRTHTPSTVMAQPPQMSIMPAQPIFTGLPAQYMMPAPVSLSMSHSFNPATMQQAPRLRKGFCQTHSAYDYHSGSISVPTSVHQPRHEFSTVAAATGQPLLAPASMPGQPHFAVHYAPQNMVHAPGQTMHYPQVVYSVVGGPRMVTPQHISMMSTSHGSFGDNQHVPNQVFVSAHPLPPGHNPPHHAGPHSNPQSQQGPPLPGQTQAAGVHPSPSPVHQPPPPQPTPPATVGAPQPLVYQQQHAAQLGQPPLQHSPHTPNSPQTIHPNSSSAPHNPLGHPNPHLHPNVSHAATLSHGGPHMSQAHSQQHPNNPGPTGYPNQAAPQQMVLIHQQAPTTALTGHPQQVPGGPAYQGPLHGPGNPGQVAHIMQPHSSMPVPVIPSTTGGATMPTPHQMPYIPHHHASPSPLQQYAHAQ